MPSRAGSPNKRKQALLALLQERYPGYQPILEMVHIAMDLNNPVELRAQMHKEVAQYVEPKRKAIEVSGNDGESLVIQIVRFSDTPAL